jgi:hypothetical protein
LKCARGATALASAELLDWLETTVPEAGLHGEIVTYNWYATTGDTTL